MTTFLYAAAGSLAITAIYLMARAVIAYVEDRQRERRYADNWRQRREAERRQP